MITDPATAAMNIAFKLPNGRTITGTYAELMARVEACDRLFTDGYRIRLLSARDWLAVPEDDLRLWMHMSAVYVLPTKELVEWLKRKIDGRPAIEIGSGNADLYFHLGIPGTDSYVQMTKEVHTLYLATGQMITRPKPDTKRLDALAAVAEYKPEVVVGCYITRRFIVGKDDARSQASAHGVIEEDLIGSVRTYIHVGNTATHATKTALATRPAMHGVPGILTRGERSSNVVYQWGE